MLYRLNPRLDSHSTSERHACARETDLRTHPLLALLCVLVASSNALGRGDLTSDIGTLVAKSGLKASQISVSVLDAKSGSVIAERQAAAPMAPASNMKVLTTGAALEVLGADFNFQTRLFLDRTAKSTRLAVVGGGDPAFGDAELLRSHSWVDEQGRVQRGIGTTALLDMWTNAVRASGVSRIDELVVDARVFESVGFHASWPVDQASSPFCAEVWGLNFRTNTLDVFPTGSGASATIGAMDPAYEWLPRKRSRVSKKGAAEDFWVGRTPGSNELVIGGGRVRNPKDALALTVHETPSLFGELLARRLRATGVEVVAVRNAAPTDPAAAGVPVGCVFQTPIAVALQRANTDSQNLYAESLFKRLGAAAANATAGAAAAIPGPGFVPGSWENGAAALRASLATRVGSDTIANWAIQDGSGLARDNRVTAEGLTLWLRSFALDPALGPAYFGSFAVAGASGTVVNRFASIERSAVRVECKTGYIRGVSCLCGRAISPDGRQYLFAILGNNLGGDGVSRARKLQEDIVTRLVRDLESHLDGGSTARASARAGSSGGAAES